MKNSTETTNNDKRIKDYKPLGLIPRHCGSRRSWSFPQKARKSQDESPNSSESDVP